ncbi:MAG: hypothetical protein HC767_01565 [Akkermansiaceae bacterium]|nr:hypothetical protein [Akkermansiaceae bacterium]
MSPTASRFFRGIFKTCAYSNLTCSVHSISSLGFSYFRLFQKVPFAQQILPDSWTSR